MQLDSKVVQCWGIGEWLDMESMIQEFCSYTSNDTALATTYETTELTSTMSSTTALSNGTEPLCPIDLSKIGVPHSCRFLFYETNMSDSQIGIILLVLSLVILCGALIIIVKLLNSMLKGKMLMLIKSKLLDKCNVIIMFCFS